MSEDPEFRTGLPLEYLDYTGIVNSESVSVEGSIPCWQNRMFTPFPFPLPKDDRRRGDFSKKLSHLFAKLLQYAPVDAAADQVRKIRNP